MMLQSLQLVLGLLFLLLLKVSERHNNAIFKYTYQGNATIIYPTGNDTENPVAVAIAKYPDEFHYWFFEVHYLSICAGFLGGTEDAYYYHLNCSARTGGFTFRSDDEFILDYQSIGDLFPVLPAVASNSFNLGPSFTMLVIGIVLAAASVTVFVFELSGLGRRWRHIKMVTAVLTLVLLPKSLEDIDITG
jgi:hypothetical protein